MKGCSFYYSLGLSLCLMFTPVRAEDSDTHSALDDLNAIADSSENAADSTNVGDLEVAFTSRVVGLVMLARVSRPQFI